MQNIGPLKNEPTRDRVGLLEAAPDSRSTVLCCDKEVAAWAALRLPRRGPSGRRRSPPSSVRTVFLASTQAR